MNTYEFLYDGEILETRLDRDGENFKVTVGETELTLHPVGQNLYTTLHNGSRMSVAAVRYKDKFYIDVDSVLIELKEATEDNVAGVAGDAGGDASRIFAPMPGKIVKILVEVGQEVNERQQMVIVEAMKMENPVLSRARGKVTAVNFAAGDQVDTESAIIELELAE
jgi:3-methylcrotonyl-CoA carboxylase alpha subunit